MKHEEILKNAENGSPSNQMFLGHCYLIGKDSDDKTIPIDYEKAKYWLEKAHSKGVGTASFLLGTIYEGGLGTTVDILRAIELYKKSAETDSILAPLALARLYAKGKGVEQSMEKAIYWYERVVANEGSIEPSVHEDSFKEIIREAKEYINKIG